MSKTGYETVSDEDLDQLIELEELNIRTYEIHIQQSELKLKLLKAERNKRKSRPVSESIGRLLTGYDE